MKTPNIDFMGWRRVASAVSLVLVLLSVGGLAFRGLDLSIEFTGGALVDVEFPVDVDVDTVRTELVEAGFSEAVVQELESERHLLIRAPTAGTDLGAVTERLTTALDHVHPAHRILGSELVGPTIGAELRDSAGLATLAALIAIGIYIMFRFAGKFSLGAIIALVHDVLITLGVFVFFDLTFDLAAFAAVLALIGYSLNDTIVVYDRIRENFVRMRGASTLTAINAALNQTLGRTIAMSGTTLFTLVALLVFGGEALRSFSLALTVGVVVGTWSSIYVASALLMFMKVDRTSLVRELPPVEG
ncbi:MAG: protein translocase subunit SecF [Pseudomonadales bacterium]|nr:protein translocase subunit SecF [Pseudomonadales bacterium]